MKKGRLKLLWQLVYIFGTLLIIYFLGFADIGFKNLGESLSQFDMNWLLLALAGILGFWLFQTLVFSTCSKIIGQKLSFGKNAKITIIGEYYSAVTPFSTGGQPMQMGYYKRYGVSIPNSTCILTIRLIGFISSLCIIYVIAVIARGAELFANNPTMMWLSIVGVSINAASVVLLILLLISKKLVYRIGTAIINLICKLKFFKKKREDWLEKYEKGVQDFAEAAKYLSKNKFGAIRVFLYSLLSIACLYSITYFIYKAMGLYEKDFFVLFSMQIFLYLSVAFMPTPGAIGASEAGFYLFFAAIFPQNLIYLAMLLWRFFTYYSNLLVGAVVVIWDEIYYMVKRRKGEDMPLTVAEEEAEKDEGIHLKLHKKENDLKKSR